MIVNTLLSFLLPFLSLKMLQASWLWGWPDVARSPTPHAHTSKIYGSFVVVL